METYAQPYSEVYRRNVEMRIPGFPPVKYLVKAYHVATSDSEAPPVYSANACLPDGTIVVGGPEIEAPTEFPAIEALKARILECVFFF